MVAVVSIKVIGIFAQSPSDIYPAPAGIYRMTREESEPIGFPEKSSRSLTER